MSCRLPTYIFRSAEDGGRRREEGIAMTAALKTRMRMKHSLCTHSGLICQRVTSISLHCWAEWQRVLSGSRREPRRFWEFQEACQLWLQASWWGLGGAVLLWRETKCGLVPHFLGHCEHQTLWEVKKEPQDTTETNLAPWRVGGGLDPDLTCFRKDKVVLSCQQLGDLFGFFFVCAHMCMLVCIKLLSILFTYLYMCACWHLK